MASAVGGSAGGRISDEVVERVREEVDILAVAEELTREQFVRATATEWGIRCPYPDHPDKTPSFHVETEKKLYFCRGCKKKGDAISLVRDLRGVSFVEAVEFVAVVMGIETGAEASAGFKSNSSSRPKKRTPAKLPLKPPPPVASPVQPVELKRGSLEGVYRRSVEALPASIGERYLVERRKLPADLLRRFGLGYAPAGAWPYDDAWRARKGETPRHLWEHGRIVVPHTRPDGVAVNLYGRAVGEADRLPPERREAFKKLKHRHLAGNRGYFNASALVSGKFPEGEALVVCEGAVDALAIIASGHERTVAIFGVNGWRWEWLPPDVGSIVFAMDADAAGDDAWRDIAQGARRMGIRVVHLTAAAYGGEKDAAAAYAKGVLDLGEFPAPPKRSAVKRTQMRRTSEEERARRRAEAEAAMERALKEAQLQRDLDVPVAFSPASHGEARRHPAPGEATTEPEPSPEISPKQVSEEPAESASDDGGVSVGSEHPSERSGENREPSSQAEAEEIEPEPEVDNNVVDLQQYAAALAEKRRLARKKTKGARGGKPRDGK